MHPNIPKPQAPPPPPTIDNARQLADQADQVRNRQGRAATFVSTPQGQQAGGSGVKMLMGQGG